MLFRISENASFVAPYHRIQKKELWLTTCFPWKYSKLSLWYRTEMDFWTSHLLKRPYSLEDSRASLKSLQYGVQFIRSLWVSLKEPEKVFSANQQHVVSSKPGNLKIAEEASWGPLKLGGP